MTLDDIKALYPLLQAMLLGTNKEAEAAQREWDKRVRAADDGERMLLEVVRQSYVMGAAAGMTNLMNGVQERCSLFERRVKGLAKPEVGG